jgi:hypothetical protein
MSAAVDRILELARDVESFELGRCSPDDADEQTAYLYAFKDIAKRFVGAARRFDDAELRAALLPLNLNPEFITEAYDLKADLIPIIDIIRDKCLDPTWGQLKSLTPSFIDPALLERIRRLQSKKFNLAKLVRFAEELNENYDRGNYLSCTLLIRAIINHVPPLFGCTTFGQVAASSPKSVKALLNQLEEGARDVGDLHTHDTVDRFSTPPTRNQLEPYKPPMEILFNEIERCVGMP